MKEIWLGLLLLPVTYQAVAAAPSSISCPASHVLPRLDAGYHACANGYVDGSCQQFVKAFKELTGRYDCERPFDTDPVPAIWLSSEGALDDYVRLLFQIASKPQYKDKMYHGVQRKAQELFTSKAFLEVLDGSLAEEYLPKSQALARKLKKSKR